MSAVGFPVKAYSSRCVYMPVRVKRGYVLFTCRCQHRHTVCRLFSPSNTSSFSHGRFSPSQNAVSLLIQGHDIETKQAILQFQRTLGSHKAISSRQLLEQPFFCRFSTDEKCLNEAAENPAEHRKQQQLDEKLKLCFRV